MKTATAKNIVRALIRALSALADQDSYAASMDACFDGGEFSASGHGPGTCDEEVDRILNHLGINRAQASAALAVWEKLETSSPKWNGCEPKSSYLSAWLVTA